MRVLVATLFLIPTLGLFAQVSDEHGDEENHHEHHKNEIGIANSAVYFINEESVSYALHLHYMRRLGESRFGIGFGYERIFDERKHNRLGPMLAYSPVDKFNLIISPGVTFEEEGSGAFAFHFEASYEFEIHDIHLGPAFEFAMTLRTSI